MFAIPLYDDSYKARPAVATWGIGIACFLFFAWQLGLGRRGGDAELAYGMVPAVLFGLVDLPARLHRVPPVLPLLTSMFLHASWLHLAGNMLYLWLFGRGVEAALGSLRFVCFYLLCGVAAALTQALIDPSSRIPMIGASGAIAGVLGAYFVLYPRAHVRVLVWFLIIVRLVTVPAFLLLGLWLLLQIVNAALMPPDEPGVAFGAHVGGFVIGAALIALFRPLPGHGSHRRWS